MSGRFILVVSHTARQEAIEATVIAVAKLREAGVTPVMPASDRKEFAPHLTIDSVAELEAEVSVSRIEVALVLGGDGTILRAAELLRGSACPILGVNLGHVGFLAETESHDLTFTLDRLLAGRYQVEERMTLEVCAYLPGVLPLDTEGAWPGGGRLAAEGERPHDSGSELSQYQGEVITRTWAVNEASVEKHGRMLEVAIGVDGRPLSSFGCDGVVLSTPTGSTAYAFSAGGPVVWPEVQALLAVPLAAHALFNRPIVVGPTSVLTVEILPQSAGIGVLWCDGRRRTELPAGTVVEVRRSGLPLRLARIDEAVFTDRLVNKFHLPVSGWRGEPGAAK